MRNNLWTAGIMGLFVFCLAIGASVYAEEWTAYGPRAQAMGGAGVALSDSSNSHYYNPAALALDKNRKVGATISISTTTAAEGDVISAVDAIATSMTGIDWPALSSKIDQGQALSPSEVSQLLKLFASDMTGLNKPAQGLMFNLTGGAEISLNKFSLFVDYSMIGGGDPVFDLGGLSFNVSATAGQQVDNVVGTGADHSTGSAQPFANPGSQALADSVVSLVNSGTVLDQNQAEALVYQAEQAGIDTSDPAIISAIQQIASSTAGLDILRGVNLPMTKATSTTAAASNNQSGLYMSGIMLREFGLSYAKPIMGEFLSVGANIKMMEGQTYYNFIKFDELQGGSDTASDITKTENLKTSSSIGLDVGALVNLTDMIKGGLVIRNLNSPKFDFAGPGGDFELEPQIRMGVSANLIGLLRLAMDYDVTVNKSLVLNGYESQWFGMGAELDLWLLKVRAGMQQNLASENAGPVMTGGVGLKLIWLQVDLAAALATDTAKIEAGSGGEEIPERLALSFQASLKF